MRLHRSLLAAPVVALTLAAGGCGAVDDLQDSADRARRDAEQLQQRLDRLQRQLDRGVIDRKAFDRELRQALEGAGGSVDQAIDALEDTGAVPDELRDELDRARDQLERRGGG